MRLRRRYFLVCLVALLNACGGHSSNNNNTPPPDATPPSTPGMLTANAVSLSQIDLSWGAATDDVGVTGYRLERCQGVGCTTFTQIATPSGTSYSDTGLSASTYSYRVRAVDAAGFHESLIVIGGDPGLEIAADESVVGRGEVRRAVLERRSGR